MNIRMFHLDAFADRPFTGNPAAVCPLHDWIDDRVMQSIAAENNVSETAFFVPDEPYYHIRWFSPASEVDLCGHATLASAHVIFTVLDPSRKKLSFRSNTDVLRVRKTLAGNIELDFPSRPPSPTDDLSRLASALGGTPKKCLAAADYMVVYDTEDEIRALQPDMDKLAVLPLRGVIATAPGGDCDFVSRFFAPKLGIPEDPVTGSSHCTLIPYWSNRLVRKHLLARQLSPRGGTLYCADRNKRVGIAGKAVVYMAGTITI